MASAGERLAELAGLESRGELMNRDELTFDEDQAEQVEQVETAVRNLKPLSLLFTVSWNIQITPEMLDKQPPTS